MHTADLLQWLRTDAYIGDVAQYPDQTDIVLLAELTHKLHTVFEDIVCKARSGYWLKEYIVSTTVGRNRYRIPPRSVTGGLEKIEIAPSGVYYEIDEISPEDMNAYEGPTSAPNVGTPVVFVSMGDQIEMFPTPNAVMPIRMTYYVRPSQLVAPQNNQLNGGTDRGRITSIANISLRQFLVNTPPFNQALAVPASITSGIETVDVVHPDGWHELALVDATQTIAGNVFTIGGTADLGDIQVGDYVRVADQTDWPCLPDDFHRCLVDVTAIKILVELGLADKGGEIANNVENDLVRFRSLLMPRVRSQPKTTPVSLKSRGYW